MDPLVFCANGTVEMGVDRTGIDESLQIKPMAGYLDSWYDDYRYGVFFLVFE